MEPCGVTLRRTAPRSTTEAASGLIGPVYAAGGALGLLWLIVTPRDDVSWAHALALVATIAVLGATFARRRGRNRGAVGVNVIVAASTLLITAGLLIGGDDAPFAVFYLWVGPFAVSLLPARHAPVHVAFIAAAYGFALLVDREGAVGPEVRQDLGVWLVTVGGVAVVGLLVRTLVRTAETGIDFARLAAERQALVARLGQQALAERLGTGPLMQAATDALRRGLDVEYAKVLECRGRDALLRAGTGWRPGCVGHATVDLGERTQAGYTLARSAPVVVEDFATEVRFSAPPLLASHGVRSGMSVVIPGRDDAWGLLGVHSTRPRAFDADDVAFLESVATVLAAAVERERSEQELTRSALHDPLTGAANRVLFEDRVQTALARAPGSGSLLTAVICLDVDAFATVNETYGHRAGDHLLRQLPARLAAAVPGATIGRLAGDHFAALVERRSSPEEVLAAARAIRRQFRVPFDLPSGPLTLSASVGIATASPGEGSASTVIRDAEAAMRRAKVRRDSSIEFFDEHMRRELTERSRTEDELRAGLRRGELRLLFQPIVALADHSVIGIEALVRWQHPVRGLVGPAEFVPLAERSALIIDIGDWVLTEACRYLAVWAPALEGSDFRLSVNVSARQITEDGFADHVEAALDRAGVPAHRLAVELTESALTDSVTTAAENLARLRVLGVHVLLDDFGTEYASLQRIRAFQFDGIKLDRSFIARLADSESDSALVAASVAMGRALGVDVVAEGIESEQQERALVGLGCAQGQGFRFGRPLPPEALANLHLAGRISRSG
jgi:diguanylate cyclase (GGDEF)-like protein